MLQAFVRPELFCAWRGPSLLVVDHEGRCGDRLALSGYYWREARHLRTLRLEIDGRLPWLTEAASLDARTLSFTCVHPERSSFGGGGTGQSGDEFTSDSDGVPHRSLVIEQRLAVSLGALNVHARLTNHALIPVEIDVAWIVAADFIDILDAESASPKWSAGVRTAVGPGSLRFVCEEPSLGYATIVAASGGGAWTASDARLAATLSLAPGERVGLSLSVEPEATGPLSGNESLREAQWLAWRRRMTRIETPGHSLAQRIIRTNVADLSSLSLLDGARDEWLAPQAGVPRYPALFGRDALTGTWQAAMLDRGDALNAALTLLGRLQGTRCDPAREEEPGRIVQQVRSGPLSRLGLLPFARYYGDYASPFMFVVALAHLYAWTGDRQQLQRHWDEARRVLDWARQQGDRDGDGYLEYLTHAKDGPKHQGWRDSGDAIVYPDGKPVPAPIATCEVQGYWHAALQLMAVMSWVMNARDDATAYWKEANSLKARFNRDWWVDDEQCIALAMDPDKRPIPAPSSSMGHCVASGIVSAEHLPRVVGRLFQPDLFNGWGIRTLSSDHVSYDPLSYHRGSVWAVESATIAFGLRRFGFDARALDLARASFDLAELYGGRAPETVGGFARGERPTPGLYPRANPVQLWNATAFPLFVHTLLGLQPVAPLDLMVADPALPSWLPEVVLRGLRLGGATATLRFWREKTGESHVEVLHKRGTFHLVRQPPPESLSVNWLDRFAALTDRLLHH